jgi:hypothetical protein
MRWLIAFAAAGLAAAPSIASDPSYLTNMLKGRVAGSPQRCILPDFSARPQVIDRTAIVYYDTHGTTYVGRFKGGCSILRDYRRITTRHSGSRLCANDAVHVAEETGGDMGFCTFSGFTPYRKK